MPYIDGLPTAASVSPDDLIVVDQGGNGTPGSATTRSAKVSQLPNGGGGGGGVSSVVGATGAVTLADLAAGGVATNTYLSPLVGGVSRTLNGKLTDIVSVKDFGAVGNGSTDDTAAIQAAVTALATTGGTVYFPRGNYLISSVITIPVSALSVDSSTGGIYFVGAGPAVSLITYAGTSASFFTCTQPSGPNVFNLSFRGLGLLATNTSYNGWHIQYQNICNVFLDECTIWGVNPTPSANGGLKGVGSVGNIFTFYLRISKCEFVGASIYLNGITDSWIDGSVLQSVIGAGTGGRAYGVQLDGPCTEIKIHNNHLYSSINGAIFATGTAGMPGVSIRGNFFDTNPASNLAGAIVTTALAENWVIVNNVMAGVPSYCIDAIDLCFSTIEGNSFVNCGGNVGGASLHTILFNKSATGCIDNCVTGNVFRNTLSLSPTIFTIFENPNSCSGSMYGANIASGPGYNSGVVHFGDATPTSFTLTWGGDYPFGGSGGGSYNPAAVAITGGTINGVVIGGTTRAAASVTTLAATGNATVGGTFIGSGLITAAAGLNVQGGNALVANTLGVGGVLTASGGLVASAGLSVPGGNLSVTNNQTIGGTLGVTGAITPSTTAGIIGTTTNNNANAGSIGEVIDLTGSNTSLTNGTAVNIFSHSLTAGDYEVTGVVSYQPAGTTTTTALNYGTSLTSGALDSFGTYGSLQTSIPAGVGQFLVLPTRRVSVATTTTVFVVLLASFAAGTATGTAFFHARRVR